MNRRNLFAAVALFAFAGSALAALSPEKAKWGEGPAQFLMTKEEAAQWKTLQTDAEADAFMTVFWARRGGVNAKNDQESRWKYADEKFSYRQTPGSMTDRGRVLAIFGVPAKVLRAERANPNTTNPGRSSMGESDVVTEDKNLAKNQAAQVWVYEGEQAEKIFGRPKVELRFEDRFNNGDFKMDSGRVDFNAARDKAIAAMIVRPEVMTVADINKPKEPALLVPPPPAPADVKTAAYAAAVADAKSGKAALGKGAVLTAVEFVSPSGDYYAPVMLYVPKSAGLAADAADTFFWTVDDASGKRVTAGEEPAKLTATRGDFYADKSINVPAAGKYTVTMGLGKAGAPVVVVSNAVDFNPIGKDASGTSRLILSDNIYELAEAAPEKAPFAFGKLKIVPKADGVFSNKDDLNYFVEINNPGIDTATNLPKLQMGIDLISKGQTVSRLPLSEAAVGSLSGKPGPGHYVLSDAIPLSKLSKPLPAGDYTLKMKIVDTVTKQSYTLEQPFKITG
ncbi:MAG TPA: GWxTD domain-containing protein [Thermoanaerobaculia bacterium]|nr:GWxTD domain-containing protein [Thermoanaerobaculia bacterium]